jgi:hypothetical protein
MDNSFDRQELDKQQQSGFWASLQIFERILNWLAGIIRLTEDEQRDAGIYVGRQRDE